MLLARLQAGLTEESDELEAALRAQRRSKDAPVVPATPRPAAAVPLQVHNNGGKGTLRRRDPWAEDQVPRLNTFVGWQADQAAD